MLRLAHRQLQIRCSIIRREPCLALRRFTPGLQIRRAYAPYPKEGVFQPNSPHRGNNLPGQTSGHREQQLRPSYPAYQETHHNFEVEQALPLNEQPQSSDTRKASRPNQFLWYAGFFCFAFGLYGASLLLELLVLPVEPGSEEDVELLGMLNAQFEELRIVKELRNAWRLNDNGEKVPAFQEWDIDHQISSNEPFIRDALAGSAGFAARRMFVDTYRKDYLFFINFGDGTNDSPGVVHAGAILTACQYAAEKVVHHLYGGKFETVSLDSVFEPLSPGQWCVIMFGLNIDEWGQDRVEISGVLCCCSDVEPALDDSTEDCHKHALFNAVMERVEPSDFPVSPNLIRHNNDSAPQIHTRST